MVEQLIRNQQVVSSILTAGLRNKKAPGFFPSAFFNSADCVLDIGLSWFLIHGGGQVGLFMDVPSQDILTAIARLF